MLAPMPSWFSVMFDMKTVIEPDPVVESSVIAHALGGLCFSKMFIMPLHLTQYQTQEPTWKKYGHKKKRFEPEKPKPKTSDDSEFEDFLARPSFLFNVFGFTGMMPQMPFFPEGLRNTHQQTEVERKASIGKL
jgi:hypothetical protein